MSATRVPGILVVYHRPDYKLTPRPFTDASTVREHIHAFAAHSRFAVWEVNTDLGFPGQLAKVHPAAVFLHYSLFSPFGYLIPNRMRKFLRSVDAFKVAFFQDEFHYCRQRFDFVNELGVDLIYTHVHPEDIPNVWGRYTPGARARFNYPGYVDSAMVAAAQRFARPDAERDIDVGYRGRPLQPYMGSGSIEKVFIGERFKELAAATALNVDIDTGEEGRVYGDDWYRFLGRCRTVLGVESGTSYLDLDDEVLNDWKARTAAGRPVTLEALCEGPLGRIDHNFSYRTISPRHFEAAAFRICQVMFEGEYSGVLKPMVHYVPLKKDFSNFDQVVELIGDPRVREEIVENAHRDLIRSGDYSYERFVADVDQDLLTAGLESAIEAGERALLDAALRRGRVRRRVLTESRYVSVIPRMIVARRVPPRARKMLRIAEEALSPPPTSQSDRDRSFAITVVCPDCRRTLDGPDSLTCAACGWAGSRIDGVPVLLSTHDRGSELFSRYLTNYDRIADDDLTVGIQPEGLQQFFNDQLFSYLGALTGKRVCDVGIGKGILFEKLRKSDVASLVGIDISMPYLTRFAGLPGELVVLANAENLPFRDSFDLVIATDILEHVLNVGDFMISLRDALAGRGRLVLRVPYKDNMLQYARLNGCDYDMVHLRNFTEGNFRHLLRHTGFVVDQLYYDGFSVWRPRPWATRTRVRPLLHAFADRGADSEERLERLDPRIGRLVMEPIVMTAVAHRA